jgi:hypothetical protein
MTGKCQPDVPYTPDAYLSRLLFVHLMSPQEFIDSTSQFWCPSDVSLTAIIVLLMSTISTFSPSSIDCLPDVSF